MENETIPLSIFLSQGQKLVSRGIISHYQSFLEHQLVNIRDLFCLSMGLIDDSIKTPSKVDGIAGKKRCFSATGLSCPGRRIDVV